jgi:hypothetical protein
MNHTRFVFSHKVEEVVVQVAPMVMAVLVVWVFPTPTQIDHYDQSNRINF